MSLFIELNSSVSSSLTPYLRDISLALVATFLVIFGDHVNGSLKRAVSNWIFPARIGAFVLMCTFGYGLLTLWGQPVMYWILTHIDFLYRPAFVLGCFCVLGFLAERKRYV
ncbi:DUF3392 domain-containing protein [Marinomonas piezotolerans]|uniref:DUF3392 domain-containing protein n=2 Tax=Marinomonas piezotolerans TaxID=2213058 RepID=A0A370U4Q0_9GAMM|nr:DUF3392 domain-containing protein [Marinomonas piezotolerans]RDL42761.1 DUF3392 domain-containing protein [Marinomonas piezotolerans]